ncbi:MAG: MBL fold metallo-hydrolase [Nitrospiraceae bacterium]|nr:MBL fold metallo-hydrolase [Nitrospiraceae bacterium]
MQSKVLFNNDGHQWIVLGRDPAKDSHVIDTNEYAIIHKGKAMLLDPGGVQIFPHVLAELAKYVRMQDIEVIFASHQDPDIVSSLAMWIDLNPKIETYCSRLWTSFVSHFSAGTVIKLSGIPDEGMRIRIGERGPEMQAVPAHYCHSSGNFSLYDPIAGILFSGDIGSALVPSHESSLVVADFQQHIQYMRGFHLRWMPSSEALRGWVQRVRAINPRMICPQHGSIFEGEMVVQLLNWLESLEVGQWKNEPPQAATRAAA